MRHRWAARPDRVCQMADFQRYEYCQGTPAGLTSFWRLPFSAELLQDPVRSCVSTAKARWPAPLRGTPSTSCTCVEKTTGVSWSRKTGRVFLRRSSSLALYLPVLQENINIWVIFFSFFFLIKKKHYLKQKVQLELVRRKHSSHACTERLVQDILCLELCNDTCMRCSACLLARTHCFSDTVWIYSGAGGWNSKTAAVLSLETGKYQNATRPAYITWAKHAQFPSSVCFSSKG